jgi:hypothetical protein
MITKHIAGYTLRQLEGHPVIYVTRPDKKVRKVLNCVLTDDSAQSIVFELGR